MPKLLVENFGAGLDLRRSELTAPAGTLRQAQNIHVTPGGELEKRLPFENIGTLPDGCVGLAALGDLFYTFEKQGAGLVSPAPGVIDIQELDTAADLIRLQDWDVYDNKLYVVMETALGDEHFYDGAKVAGGIGNSIKTYRNKIHSVIQGEPNLYFSAVGDPTDWAGTGSGFINISAEDADSAQLIGVEAYYGRLAVMSLRSTTLWTVDPDPLNYQQEQILRQAGTVSHQSMRGLGEGDVLYVSDTGIRSLRARDSSNAAAVSDVGSPIDAQAVDMLRALPADQLSRIRTLIEPLTGRVWVCYPDRALVLSFYPSPKVTAWSEYVFPFAHEYSASSNTKLGFMCDNNCFHTYDHDNPGATELSDPTVVRFPYLHMGDPARFKKFISLDVTATGTWDIFAGLDPSNPAARDKIATIDGSTFLAGRIPIEGSSTHIGLTFENTVAGGASLANTIITYQEGQEDY